MCLCPSHTPIPGKPFKYHFHRIDAKFHLIRKHCYQKRRNIRYFAIKTRGISFPKFALIRIRQIVTIWYKRKEHEFSGDSELEKEWNSDANHSHVSCANISLAEEQIRDLNNATAYIKIIISLIKLKIMSLASLLGRGIFYPLVDLRMCSYLFLSFHFTCAILRLTW